MKDKLIPYEQTIQIFEKYSGKKSINITEGDHNTPRQKHLIYKIISFFCKYLGEDYYEENNNFEESEGSEENSDSADKEHNINQIKKTTIINDS